MKVGKCKCVGTMNGGNCVHVRDVTACWRCDKCPRAYGFRLGKGDYCPKCASELRARGYVWSDYYGNYVTREELEHGEHEHTASLIRDAHEKRLLESGKFVRHAAENDKDGYVKVWFRGANGQEQIRFMKPETYRAIPLNVNATIEDYQKFGEVIADFTLTS